MVILPTKLRNAVLKACIFSQEETLEFHLRTVIVNGCKRGCSGFIKNLENGAVVYVNTERPVYSGLKNYMYRYADDIHDYRGYRNCWADTLEELSQGLAKLLKTSDSETKEVRV